MRNERCLTVVLRMLFSRNVIVGTFICGMILLVFYRLRVLEIKGNDRVKTLTDDFKLEFIPKGLGFSCNDLFINTTAKDFQMSKLYEDSVKEFDEAVTISMKGKRGPVAGYLDGHSYLLPEQYRALHYMASLKNVRTICETGFNYGHSAFNFLTANEAVKVYSFDIGSHFYTQYMVDYLQRKFPGRMHFYRGDSRKSLPRFFKENPKITCDLAFIDGAHVYEVAKEDMSNFIGAATSKLNLIVMDDYPVKSAYRYGKAWEEEVEHKRIREIMRCEFTRIVKKHTPYAGFIIGTVIKKTFSNI